ncbi:TPA: hypothetical protein ACFP4Q_000803 [Neisseria weaveri]
MKEVTLHAQYCDDIIDHANNGKYSAIGVYTGAIVADDLPAILPKLCINLSFSIPTERQDVLADGGLHFETMKNDELIALAVMNIATPKITESGQSIADNRIHGILRQIINGLPLQENSIIKTVMKVDGITVAESEPLHIIRLPRP